MIIFSFRFVQLSLWAGVMLGLAVVRAQTITFNGAQSPGAVYLTSAHQPADALVFAAGASLDQRLVVDTNNFSVTMNSGSLIQPPTLSAYALRFDNAGGSLTADGATLRAYTTGVLLFQQAAEVDLTNTTIDFTPVSAANVAAVLLQNGGTFAATGGSIAYNPQGVLSSFNYAFRSTAGTLALSLTDVAVTGGTTTNHRSYGIDLTGGGSVELLGTTTVTSRQGETLKLNGAYTVTNAGTITRLSATGTEADGAVRLAGGASTWTNTATGVINGTSDTTRSGGAVVVSTDAGGSTIANAGTIEGITTENTGGYRAALTISNTGTITALNQAALTLGGGSVTNTAGGNITVSDLVTAIVVSGGQATADFNLTNAATISGGTGVNAYARTVSVTNQAGATITGTGTGTNEAINLRAVDSATVTNAGTLTGRTGAYIYATDSVGSTQSLNVTNTGTITGTASQGLRVDSGGAFSAARNISITNQAGALIQGGTVAPGAYNIVNAAVYAAAVGSATLTIDNHGTIDARSQTSAIGVSVRDDTQATVTLHTGSTTTGAIRGVNFAQGTDIASITLAFSGTGSYDGTTAGINRYLKSTAGTWTYSGERTGGRIEVTGGTLEMTNRDLGSSTNTTVTNGTLRIAPVSAMASGNLGLNTNSLTVDTGGRLEISANARVNFGGNAGTQEVKNAGVLLIDGVASFSNNANFAGLVTTNGLLAGTGRSLGYVRVENSGILDVGNGNLGSAGLLRTFEFGGSGGGFVLGDGGILRWTLASLTESGAGVNFDQIGLDNVTSLTYEAGALLALDFAAFGDGPEAGEIFWATDRQWSFIDGGTITDGANLVFAATGQSTYTFAGLGYFALNGDGRTLSWTANATAVPEPSTYALLGGLGALGLVWWRRRARG